MTRTSLRRRRRGQAIELVADGVAVLAQIAAAVIIVAWLLGFGSPAAWPWAIGVAMLATIVKALASPSENAATASDAV